MYATLEVQKKKGVGENNETIKSSEGPDAEKLCIKQSRRWKIDIENLSLNP